jgi:glycosyltransferase involved in cell wall biosynthesis
VPPPLYGGTESVVDELAVGLRRAGHDVLLFTTGDSTCPVARQWVLPRAEGMRMNDDTVERRHVTAAYDAVQGFDIVHDHTTIGPVYAERFPDLTVVSTIHGPLDPVAAEQYERMAGRVALVAISEAQAASAPHVGVARVIRHGVDATHFPLGEGPGRYCAFLGRMCADKGAHRALDVARRAGLNLVVVGKMRTQAEQDYFQREVKPRLGEDAWYVGEVPHARKLEILQKAWCLLFPIRWPEPFGLVMIEALACGTPVLAFPEGAAPEVIDHGVTGFLCDGEDDMVEALARVHTIDRHACRRAVEDRFSSERMVDEHIALYLDLLDRDSSRRLAPSMMTNPDLEPMIGIEAIE